MKKSIAAVLGVSMLCMFGCSDNRNDDCESCDKATTGMVTKKNTSYFGRDVGKLVDRATEAISENEGSAAKSRVESMDENQIKRLGED